MDLFRLAEGHDVVKSLEKSMGVYRKVYPDILKALNIEEKQINKYCSGTSPQQKFLSKVASLIRWLNCKYEHMLPDRMDDLIGHWAKSRLHTGALKNVAKVMLATEFLTEALGVAQHGQGQERPYLESPGLMPFFTGVSYRVDADFALWVRNYLEINETDSEAVKTRKKNLLRECVMAVMNAQRNDESFFGKLWDVSGGTTKNKFGPLVNLLKKLFNHIGVDVVCNRTQRQGVRRNTYSVKQPVVYFACALCLIHHRHEVIQLFPILFSQNTEREDQVWMKESIQIFVNCCVNRGEDPSVPNANANGSLVGVSMQRLGELAELTRARDLAHISGMENEYERDARDDDREGEDRETLEEQRRIASDAYARGHEYEERLALQRAVDIDPDDTAFATPPERPQQRRSANRFVDDEAHGGGETSDTESETSDSHGTTRSSQRSNRKRREPTSDSDSDSDSDNLHSSRLQRRLTWPPQRVRRVTPPTEQSDTDSSIGHV
jgi:hypothetical protein